MRIPVFARGANPRVDRPFLKKSESYAEGEVLAGHADWLDPDDHTKGILCRELLYFGPRPTRVETVHLADLELEHDLAELPGLRFVYDRERNPTIPSIQIERLLSAAPGWDWSAEAAASATA